MKAQVLLRLFKVVFGSVTLFPKNERMLRPHLQTIVLSCLRYTTRVKDPTNYYFLLRALFRSISGGKFESSYKVGVGGWVGGCNVFFFGFERVERKREGEGRRGGSKPPSSTIHGVLRARGGGEEKPGLNIVAGAPLHFL